MSRKRAPFAPGDRVEWSGKPATVTRLHRTAPQMYVRCDGADSEILLGFDNAGVVVPGTQNKPAPRKARP